MSTTNPKVSIEDVLAAARDAGVPANLVEAMKKDLLAAAEAEKAGREPAQKSKAQFIVILDDPEGQVAGKTFLGHVLQIEDSAPPQSALDRAKAAGRAFNESKKGKRKPAKNLRETFSSVPRKFWKDGIEGHKTLPKTKELVPIFVTKGELT